MKTVFKIFILINLFVLQLFSNVFLSAPQAFVENEPYFFSIQASGENIDFPVIEKIDGFIVEQSGTSRSISNINGNITSKLIRRYKVYPTSNITIPPFELTIDGKVYTTKKIEVSKQNLQKTESSYFDFNISSATKEVFVGENIEVKLRFKHRKDVKILQMSLTKPNFENFWFKRLESDKKYEDGNFIVQELSYLVFPQKSGQLRVEPLSIELSVLDLNSNAYSFFGSNTKNMKIYSNDIVFDVKPLPKNTSLIGKFSIKTSLDKTTINEGESLNYKVEIEGTGNIDDVQDIKLNILNTTIYENKAEITSQIENGQYKGSYKKSFSLLPTSNITIPKIRLSYFDKKSNSVKTVQSESYNIKVNKKVQPAILLEKSKTLPTIQKEKIVIKSSMMERLTFFLAGVLVTILSIGLYFYVINKRSNQQSNELPLLKQLNRCKNSSDLIKILLPYITNNDEVKALVFDLENSDKQSFKELKNLAKSLIKKYNLKV